MWANNPLQATRHQRAFICSATALGARLNRNVGRRVYVFGNAAALIVAIYELLSAFALEISMSTSLELLEAEALKLAPADRSHLLERLVASLDSDPDVEAAWEREADRREADLESGSVSAVPGDEAMARLRSKLSR